MIKLKKKTPLIDQHDKFGFYGNKFGGNYCAETMRKPIEDLSKLFEKLRRDRKFSSSSGLIKQMNKDVILAKKV